MGQQLDNSQGSIADDLLSFNRSFIRANHICGITIERQLKRDGEGISSTGEDLGFTFNNEGEMVSRSEIIFLFGTPDTTYTLLEYLGGKPGQIVEQNARSRTLWEYAWSDSTHCTISRYRQDAEGTGRRTLINEESLNVTRPNDTTEIALYRNDIGLPYYRETTTRNKSGFLLSSRREFLISGETTKYTYIYTAHGRIASRKEMKNGKEQETKYRYDDLGNLLSFTQDVRGETRETQILYGESGVIEAILTRNEGQHRIEILKFTYDYCE